MREKMPGCAAFVDALRDAFGAAEMNRVIKRGLRSGCEPEDRVYFAEAGQVLGQPFVDPRLGVTAAQMVIGEQVVSKQRGSS